jgi:hypothetical protein
LPEGFSFSDLTRLNFVAILSVLKDLTRDDLASHDAQIYEDLPRNQSRAWSDFAIRGGHVLQPGVAGAFRADLAFDVLLDDRQLAGCSDEVRIPSSISLLGDASYQGSRVSVDATGRLLLAPFDVGIRGWSELHWIDDENLTRLARLGIGVIYWEVDTAVVDAARAHARAVAGRGKPRIEVRTDTAIFPEIVLSGPLSANGSISLVEVLAALGLKSPYDADIFKKLWVRTDDDKAGLARLRKNQPASFILVSSTGDGQIDLNNSRLISVWLDGQEITLEAASGQ